MVKIGTSMVNIGNSVVNIGNSMVKIGNSMVNIGNSVVNIGNLMVKIGMAKLTTSFIVHSKRKTFIRVQFRPSLSFIRKDYCQGKVLRPIT